MDQICEAQPTTDPIRQNVQEKQYGGVRRLGYFLGTLGLAVSERVCDAAGRGEPRVAFLGLIVILILAFALVVSRLRNIGMNEWWSLLTLVPIAGIYILIKCLVCPEGYEDAKKLDGTGKVVAGIGTTLVLLVVVALILSVGKGAHSPSACEASVSPQQPTCEYSGDGKLRQPAITYGYLRDPDGTVPVPQPPTSTVGKWIETHHYKYQVQQDTQCWASVALYEKHPLKSDEFIGWMVPETRFHHALSADAAFAMSEQEVVEAIKEHQQAAGDTEVIRVTDPGPPAIHVQGLTKDQGGKVVLFTDMGTLEKGGYLYGFRVVSVTETSATLEKDGRVWIYTYTLD